MKSVANLIDCEEWNADEVVRLEKAEGEEMTKELTFEIVTADDAELVFAHYCDGGWMLEVYYSQANQAWWLNCPDMEYEHGLIKPEELELILASYILNDLSIVMGCDDLGKFEGWATGVKDMVKNRDLLGELPGAQPGFVNMLSYLFPPTKN